MFTQAIKHAKHTSNDSDQRGLWIKRDQTQRVSECLNFMRSSNQIM